MERNVSDYRFVVCYRGTMYIAMTLTVTNLITIRKSGLYDRTWVAGNLLSATPTCYRHILQVLVL